MIPGFDEFAPESISAAVEMGDRLEVLRRMRAKLTKELDAWNADEGGDTRRLVILVKEVAALGREIAQLAPAEVKESPLDELRARREVRRSGAS